MKFGCRSISGSRARGALAVWIAAPALLAGACATGGGAPDAASTADPARATAISSARAAVAQDPHSAAARAELGAALLGRGDLEPAHAEFREATRLEPAHAVYWLQLAEVCEAMGRGEEGLRSLERGLAANPGDAGLLNQLGWLHATAADPAVRDPEKALGYARAAVEASGGDDANIVDTLAEAYYANREFDAAIETGQRALELAPDSEALRGQLEKFRAAKAAEGAR